MPTDPVPPGLCRSTRHIADGVTDIESADGRRCFVRRDVRVERAGDSWLVYFGIDQPERSTPTLRLTAGRAEWVVSPTGPTVERVRPA